MKIYLFLLFSLFLFLGCDKAVSETAAYGGTNGQGGSLARFTIVGNYLYTVDKEDLKVYDVTNAAEPIYKRTVPVGFEIETIFPFKNRLFIGSTSVVHIFDIADPASPKKLSEAISPQVLRRCDPVVAKDTVAYATLRTNGACGGNQSILAVYDIKNVSAPIQRSAISVGEPYGLGYADNALYVCDKMQGLMVFDITNAYAPQYVKSKKDGEYMDVIPYNDILVCWVKQGMLVYDITNKMDPVLLTRID